MTGARFFFDVGSPYAWLAAERVDDVLPEPPVWVPVLLGGIFRATGRSSWAQTETRAEGVAEIERRARERGLPRLRWPSPWPNDGLLAMRAATAADLLGAGRAFALAAMRLQFTEGRPLGDPTHVAEAARRAGLDGAALLDAAAGAETKGRLREQTDAALAAGVTGVPAVLVDETAFWGDDRLEEAAAASRRA